MAAVTGIADLFSSITENMDPNSESSMTADQLAKLTKQLYFLLQHLDSLNVKSITTEITTISSEDGTTVLDGSQIKMYDSSGTLRLLMGENPTSGDFEFIMYNEAGDPTLYIDSNGDAVYEGTIEAGQINVSQLSAISANLGTITAGSMTAVTINGGVITGALFRTSVTGDRVSIDNNAVSFATDGGNNGSLDISDVSPQMTLFGNNNMRIWAVGVLEFVASNVTWSGNTIATQFWVNSQGFGDITAVNAGTGLSGGGSSGSVTLNIDNSVVTCSASGVTANGLNIVYSSFGITIQRTGSSDSITLPWD